MNQNNKFLQFLSEMFNIGIGFLKAQLIFFGINLVLISIFLFIFDQPWAILIALGISIMDLLPVIGSGLVFIPWIIVSLILGNNTLALQLGLLYIGLVILRQILEPIITGSQIGIKPLIALGAAVAGLFILGPVGLILGPIIAAVVNVIMRINRRSRKPADNAAGENNDTLTELDIEPKYRQESNITADTDAQDSK